MIKSKNELLNPAGNLVSLKYFVYQPKNIATLLYISITAVDSVTCLLALPVRIIDYIWGNYDFMPKFGKNRQ